MKGDRPLRSDCECQWYDMRQWYRAYDNLSQQQHANKKSSATNNNSSLHSIHHQASTTAPTKIDYFRVGCPWQCTPNQKLKAAALQADVLVFNVGAHYELGPGRPVPNHNNLGDNTSFAQAMAPFADLLSLTVQKNGSLVLIRSPSATHYMTPDGLYDEQDKNLDVQCAPHANLSISNTNKILPPSVAEQDRTLRALARSLYNNNALSLTTSAQYLDVYPSSNAAWAQHRTNDCKHFCQHCSLLRSWNVHTALRIHEWMMKKKN